MNLHPYSYIGKTPHGYAVHCPAFEGETVESWVERREARLNALSSEWADFRATMSTSRAHETERTR